MVDTWVSLLVAGTLLLVGFAAALAFRRFHVPDFILLMFLGAGLGLVPFAPFGANRLLASLGPLLPLFTQLTIAFILFEGGLSLRLKESGRSLPAIVGHSVGAMALTAVFLWFFATRILFVGDVTALVFALAFSGPSASVALSFATRMRLDPRAETAIVLEGVLTNVIAVIGVLFVLQWYGTATGMGLISYVVLAAEAIVVAVAAGFLWGRVVERLSNQPFVSIASLALAIVVYGLAQGFMNQNGALAVFILGIVVGYERATHAPAGKEKPVPQGGTPAERTLRELEEFVDATDGVTAGPVANGSRGTHNLKQFQTEITFALRTFFFVYLGLLLVSEWGGVGSIFTSLILALLTVAAFLVGRLPSSALLGWGLTLFPRDTRAVFASAARGMTDVVLVLFAAQSGILPATEVSLLLGLIPMIVLIAAIVSAILVFWAGRSPGVEEAAALAVPHAPAAANGSGRHP